MAARVGNFSNPDAVLSNTIADKGGDALATIAFEFETAGRWSSFPAHRLLWGPLAVWSPGDAAGGL